MLELRTLEFFVSTADAKSLTKAAVNLGVSHSVLSRRLREMETSLGYSVFQRNGRGMLLTDSGRQLYPYAKDLLNGAKNLSEHAKSLGNAPSGTVSIGMPGSLAIVLGGPLYQRVRSEYPLITIRIIEALSGTIDEMLTLGRIDFAIIYSEHPDAKQGERPLCLVEHVLVAAAGDPRVSADRIDLKELDGVPMILPSFPHTLRQLIEETFAANGFRAKVPFEANSLLTIAEIVAAGGGCTIAPLDAVANDINLGRLQTARLNPPIQRKLVFAPATRGATTGAARAVKNIIFDLIQSFIADGRWKTINADQ